MTNVTVRVPQLQRINLCYHSIFNIHAFQYNYLPTFQCILLLNIITVCMIRLMSIPVLILKIS